MASTNPGICHVCGEATEAHTYCLCGGCGMVFHLNARADMPGKDCGQVWIGEEHQALEFACNVCLTPAAPAELTDVIDISEAASVAGIEETELRLAVESGVLPAKRLSGDIIIFQRRDVIAFASRTV